MRFLFIVIFLFSIAQNAEAQRHEIGVYGGGANVIGDVGKANYINPFPRKKSGNSKLPSYIPAALGALYRFNFNPHMGVRASLSYARFADFDFSSKEDYKLYRNKTFSNSLFEGAILFEYNFFDINDEQKFGHSPFIFFGGSVFNTRRIMYDYNADNNRILVKEKRETDFSLPFGAGYKVKLNYNWVVGLEVGFRYTGVDYLDNSDPIITDNLKQAVTDGKKDQSEIDRRIFGNKSNNDWYVITGLSITYAFGRPPCYCN